MQIKTASLLIGAASISAFQPQRVPVSVTVPIPRNTNSAPPLAPKAPSLLKPTVIEKRPPEPAPTLQDYLPTKTKGGRHTGIQAYEKHLPELTNEFMRDDTNNTVFHDKISLFWLDQLKPIFSENSTLSEQRQQLDQLLIKAVKQQPASANSGFQSDHLKGKDMEQSIEYLRLAILALKQSFKSEHEPGLEQYRRQYNPKDGSATNEPEITVSDSIATYLSEQGVNPVKVALAIENVLDTRHSRLVSRSKLVPEAPKPFGLFRP